MFLTEKAIWKELEDEVNGKHFEKYNNSSAC